MEGRDSVFLKTRYVCFENEAGGMLWKPVVVGALLVVMLTGCSHPSLALNPEEGDIPIFFPTSAAIPVQKLDTEKESDCQLAGVDLILPDGERLTIDEHASSGAATMDDLRRRLSTASASLASPSASPRGTAGMSKNGALKKPSTELRMR